MNSIPRGVVRSLAPILSLFALAAIAAYPLSSAAGTDTFEYDELGRLKKVTYANGTSMTYTLDAAGTALRSILAVVAAAVEVAADTANLHRDYVIDWRHSAFGSESL